MKQYTFTGGELRESDIPELSFNGLGFFETLLWNGFALLDLERHLQRLKNSLATFFSDKEYKNIKGDSLSSLLVSQFTGQRCRVRLTVYASESLQVIVSIAQYESPHDGLTLRSSNFQPSAHRPLSGHKSTSYGDYALAYQEALSRDADEALLMNTEGYVCEGATSNLFALINGIWVTPPLSSGCLPGIMRGLVIERCKLAGLVYAEENISREEILTADAVLVTNSLRRVQQVICIDETRIAKVDEKVLVKLLD